MSLPVCQSTGLCVKGLTAASLWLLPPFRWFATTYAFAKWWVALASKPGTDIEALLVQCDQRFASLYHRFLHETGHKLFGTGTVSAPADGPPAAPSGADGESKGE